MNLQDPASVNIRDRLLETDDWEVSGRFRGHPIHQRAYDMMVEVDGPSVTDERLTIDLEETGWPIHAVWFLSKHRAASGQPSLTVHPIGNHGSEAKFGGRPETCSPAAARDMAALLRRLRHRRDERGLPHDVTFEATHHGPFMTQPSLFVEIGSDDDWYDDRPSGEVLAAAVTDVLDGEGSDRDNAPVLLGVGGGHYVPQMTDKAIAGEADFGHLVPSYAMDAEDADASLGVLDRAWDASPGASAVYMHKKGLKGPQRQIVRDWCEARGVSMDH